MIVGAGLAWAAGIDNLVPTANWNQSCASGFSANRLCKTDNKDVYFYMDHTDEPGAEYKLEDDDRTNVDEMLRDEYAAKTDLSYHYDSTPVYSGSGETDTIYQESADGLDSGTIGVTWCSDVVNGSDWHCDQHFVRIRHGYYSKRVACHESGHAVGLTHGNIASPVTANGAAVLGCMRTPLESLTSADLGANQVDRINSNY